MAKTSEQWLERKREILLEGLQKSHDAMEEVIAKAERTQWDRMKELLDQYRADTGRDFVADEKAARKKRRKLKVDRV